MPRSILLVRSREEVSEKPGQEASCRQGRLVQEWLCPTSGLRCGKGVGATPSISWAPMLPMGPYPRQKG